MTQCRIYHGVKFHIQDSWKCGHINLVINNIDARQSQLEAMSASLSEDLGVNFQDFSKSNHRVWGISRDQFKHFLGLTYEG